MSGSPVQVHNEWDPLEEMIVGIADNARVPSADPGLFAVNYADDVATPQEVPSGPYNEELLDEANEDLATFAAFLEENGVTVRRPDVSDHGAPFATPDWSSDGEYNYCPRDVLLAIGETVIETPMVMRSRYFEPLAYRSILLDYFQRGAHWISAPKPRLLDDTWNLRPSTGSVLNDEEPVFDAANVLRMGRDILYLVSRSGNRQGLEWLRRTLGPEYRVHPIEGIYDGTHIDTTITLVRPGLVVLNPERISPQQVPDVFKSWDVLWCPDNVDTGYAGSFPRASVWQAGLNFIMVNPDLAVVNDKQLPLIRALEERGVGVAPLPMRHARSLSGGFHCVSLDVRRRGSLESYT